MPRYRLRQKVLHSLSIINEEREKASVLRKKRKHYDDVSSISSNASLSDSNDSMSSGILNSDDDTFHHLIDKAISSARKRNQKEKILKYKSI